MAISSHSKVSVTPEHILHAVVLILNLAVWAPDSYSTYISTDLSFHEFFSANNVLSLVANSSDSSDNRWSLTFFAILIPQLWSLTLHQTMLAS